MTRPTRHSLYNIVEILWRKSLLILIALSLWGSLTAQQGVVKYPQLLRKGAMGEVDSYLDYGQAGQRANKDRDLSAAYQVLGISLGFLVAIIALYLVSQKFLNKRREAREELERASMKLDLMYTRFQLASEERRLVEELAGGTTSEFVSPILEEVENFEKKVEEWKAQPHENKELQRVFNLRQRLGYDFGNKRCQFIRTQMLNPGLEKKLECQLPITEKVVLFMTPILDVTESRIVIKPPTIKGKPANLKKFPYLICKIRRDDDAEYEFKLPVLNQISGKMNVVVLGHAKEINKMFIRESDRIECQIQSTFAILNDQQLEQKMTAGKKAKGEMVLDTFDAMIVDISQGGAKIVTQKPPVMPVANNFVLFNILGANLKEDVMAKVLRVIEKDGMVTINIQFHRLRELVRMRINKFLFTLQKEIQDKLASEGAPVPETKEGSPNDSKATNEAPKPIAAKTAPFTPPAPASKTTPQKPAAKVIAKPNSRAATALQPKERNALLG